MFEAVGLQNYDGFFGACDRLLEPHGTMLLQTITIHEQKYPTYRRSSDWIQKHIFPGSELASVLKILRSLVLTNSTILIFANWLANSDLTTSLKGGSRP
jgi:cyclopropane-fatty-acyl-phospholipid synthase